MSWCGENCDVIQICKQETKIMSLWPAVSTQEIDGGIWFPLKELVFSWIFLQKRSRFHEFSVGAICQGFGKKFAKGFPENSANWTWEVVSKGFNTPILCYNRYTVLVPDTCKPQESWDLKSLVETGDPSKNPSRKTRSNPSFFGRSNRWSHFGTTVQ